MARLVYMDAHGHQQIWQIDGSRARIVIGRHPDCDLVAPDLGVSRQHCALTRHGDGHYEIEDLGSQNGTLLNHSPVTRGPLKSHDIIRCAGLVLQFFEDSSIDPSQTYPMDDGSVQAQAANQAAMHAEIERLTRYNENQSNALARLQDALHEQSQALTTAQGEIAALRAELDGRQLPPTREMAVAEEDDLPKVAVLRTPLKPKPDVTPAREAGRIAELEAALAASQAKLAEAQAAAAAAELPPAPTPPDPDGEAAETLRERVAELESELNRARASFMATDAEQLARMAVLERELERTDARLGAAESVAEGLEDQLVEAQAWLEAVGARLQQEVESLTAKLETARSATAEARQSARAAGKLRREVRQAEARADAAEGRMLTTRSHARALAQALDPLLQARDEQSEEAGLAIDAIAGLINALNEEFAEEEP